MSPTQDPRCRLANGWNGRLPTLMMKEVFTLGPRRYQSFGNFGLLRLISLQSPIVYSAARGRAEKTSRLHHRLIQRATSKKRKISNFGLFNLMIEVPLGI